RRVVRSIASCLSSEIKPADRAGDPLARVPRLRRRRCRSARGMITTPPRGARRTLRVGKRVSGAGWRGPGKGEGMSGSSRARAETRTELEGTFRGKLFRGDIALRAL